MGGVRNFLGFFLFIVSIFFLSVQVSIFPRRKPPRWTSNHTLVTGVVPPRKVSMVAGAKRRRPEASIPGPRPRQHVSAEEREVEADLLASAEIAWNGSPSVEECMRQRVTQNTDADGMIGRCMTPRMHAILKRVAGNMSVLCREAFEDLKWANNTPKIDDDLLEIPGWDYVFPKMRRGDINKSTVHGWVVAFETVSLILDDGIFPDQRAVESRACYHEKLQLRTYFKKGGTVRYVIDFVMAWAQDEWENYGATDEDFLKGARVR